MNQRGAQITHATIYPPVTVEVSVDHRTMPQSER